MTTKPVMRNSANAGQLRRCAPAALWRVAGEVEGIPATAVIAALEVVWGLTFHGHSLDHLDARSPRAEAIRWRS